MKYIASYWKLRIDGSRLKQIEVNLKADNYKKAYDLADRIARLDPDNSVELIGLKKKYEVN